MTNFRNAGKFFDTGYNVVIPQLALMQIHSEDLPNHLAQLRITHELPLINIKLWWMNLPRSFNSQSENRWVHNFKQAAWSSGNLSEFWFCRNWYSLSRDWLPKLRVFYHTITKRKTEHFNDHTNSSSDTRKSHPSLFPSCVKDGRINCWDSYKSRDHHFIERLNSHKSRAQSLSLKPLII